MRARYSRTVTHWRVRTERWTRSLGAARGAECGRVIIGYTDAGVREPVVNGMMRGRGVPRRRSNAAPVVDETQRDAPSTGVPAAEGVARRSGLRVNDARTVRVSL
jgi:hypothetical protein